MSNGAGEFCQEFRTDVAVDNADRLGEVDGGWAIMGRWLHAPLGLDREPRAYGPFRDAPRGARA